VVHVLPKPAAAGVMQSVACAGMVAACDAVTGTAAAAADCAPRGNSAVGHGSSCCVCLQKAFTAAGAGALTQCSPVPWPVAPGGGGGMLC
jgi:hypothetical protein